MAIYKGSQQIKNVYLGNKQYIKVYKGSSLVYLAGLPEEYQEVEWIDSEGASGTDPGPYIDIDFIPDDTAGFEVELYFDQVTSDSSRLGVRQTSNTDSRFTFGTASSKAYFGWGTTIPASSSDRPSVSAETWYNIKHNFKNDRKCQVNNVACVENLSTLSVEFTYSVIIGGFSLAGAIRSRAIRIRKGIFTRGTTIERYLIPCYRIADTEIGLYDLVERKFYPNAGAGSFTKGGDVE